MSSQLFEPVVAEFAGNPRMRCGVWLILGILSLYCILVQSDRVAAVHDEYAAEAHRLLKAETLSERRDWLELLEAERETHRELTGAFWQAETKGLAQAKLQGALTGMIEGLDLRDVYVRSGVSQPVPELPGVWRVQTRLEATYLPGGELQVLHAVATYPKKLVVDRLDLSRQRGGASRLLLILSAYFVGVEVVQEEQ